MRLSGVTGARVAGMAGAVVTDDQGGGGKRIVQQPLHPRGAGGNGQVSSPIWGWGEVGRGLAEASLLRT